MTRLLVHPMLTVLPPMRRYPTSSHPNAQGIREGRHPGSLLWEALDKTKALSYYTYHIDLLGQIYLTV